MAEFILELERQPFFINRETEVKLFKGSRFLKDFPDQRQPIVVKEYNCTRAILEESIDVLNERIREGLAQVRADHPHVCKLFDMHVRMTGHNEVFVSHVLEALDKDVSKVIGERKKNNSPYTEPEIRTFIKQVAEALAYTHSKDIAHCDIKPANVFLTSSGEYKVGDFGSFWEKKAVKDQDQRSLTGSGLGTPVFMSPQMKKIPQNGVHWAKKSDVYSLGASVLNLATLDLPHFLDDVDHLDEVVALKVGSLRISGELRMLLCDMLSTQEDRRPTMQEVLDRLTSPPLSVEPPAIPAPTSHVRMEPREEFKQSRHVAAEESKRPVSPRQFSTQKLARVTSQGFQLFNFQSNSWKAAVNFDTDIKCDKGSKYAFVDETRIVVCGNCWKSTGNGDEAYLVHEEGRVQELPSMKKRRWGAGLVVDSGEVFAFGGNPQYLASLTSPHSPYDDDDAYNDCIALKLSDPQAWMTQEGQMTERKTGFVPCVFSSKVYLCGPRAIDVFDLAARHFENRLGITFQKEAYVDRVSFVVENELVVISRTRTTRINLSTSSTQEEQHKEVEIGPKSNVVVAGGFVYWVRGSQCIKATLQQPTRFEEF